MSRRRSSIRSASVTHCVSSEGVQERSKGGSDDAGVSLAGVGVGVALSGVGVGVGV